MTIPSNITYFIEELEVPSESVSEDIQLFASDIIYRIFYGSASELNKLHRSGRLNDKVVQSTILGAFNEVVDILVSHYDDILGAVMRIDDVYVSNSTLFNYIKLTVQTSEGNIDVKAEANLP